MIHYPSRKMQLAFNLKKTIFSLLFLSFLLAFHSKSYAFQKAAADTISTADVDFAPLPADTSTTTKAAAPVKKEVVKEKSKAIEAKQEQQSLWAIFLAGLFGGFAALIMPCIFPMLPLTVSYFTKTAQSRGSAITKALIYGLSIIVIYVAFGLIITVIFGADALNDLATNGAFNLIFFLLLIVFAVSFFGAFEITLPSAWANKMDEQSDKGGWLGLFFMAATLALVSFSCTGPIIGTLLVQAATSGALLGPAIGMFGFSLALAIPFALFAMFPSWLNSLPKSGGWLNSVKIVLGFLELALALKFLSNVDLAYHWEWFDREIFLVLWIVIFGLMGMYLLGKLKFSHDSPVDHLSIPRLFLAIIVLSFTVYMVPGLWGAPLKSISAFLPPLQTQDFDLYTPSLSANSRASNTSTQNSNEAPHKYANLFKAPLGLNAFFDYDEALAFAKKNHKPVMIDFTGHACVNCRKMEASVWTDKKVYDLISNDFVLLQLYVDDKTDLQPNEQTVTLQGKKIKTIGNKWSDFQASRFKANSQPFYVLLDDDGNLLVPPQGADYNPASYGRFLQSGLTAFGKK
ncbi:cytochrome c biogenesis protein CcdA [uncultured Mucilaginibacter sp.]|uniref:protein-disulfide reductase DsbD family protein n=1 Tax=uncultured Mucilaginibacter sp. TaxID=797541 RepID=UPI002627A021|nr:cytochrome c biogenesis protein CcdA [uncultured Mucilaginibacter sp.]